jgi:hypothetical protein
MGEDEETYNPDDFDPSEHNNREDDDEDEADKTQA